ncbi:MAG: 4,5-DOPA dioxygenase extradiol [Cardiobacteriaceae bacterium]|nr:4,5-DOPA dioxygenase extradiol [Cardiobacteriaceae bacterium]
MSSPMPALFVGHGSPMNAIRPQSPFNLGFARATAAFARPKAILCLSAHWYIHDLRLTGSPRPPMIYDFHGFPDALGEVQYPAPGSPALAARVQALLADAEAQIDPARGFDHGAWAVLKYLYPDADIPVVQMSIDRRQSAAWHFALARRLRPLRDEGVLILGSGDIVHNLRAVSFAHMDDIGAGYDWAYAFRDAINQAIADNDTAALIEFERFGEAAQLSVPTPDHYLPLLYVMAQRDAGDAVSVFNDALVGGSISMTSVLVGAELENVP